MLKLSLLTLKTISKLKYDTQNTKTHRACLGLSQCRLLYFTPPPHVLVHAPYEPQGPQLPSTGGGRLVPTCVHVPAMHHLKKKKEENNNKKCFRELVSSACHSQPVLLNRRGLSSRVTPPQAKRNRRGEWIPIREPVSNLLYCGLARFRTKSTLKLRKQRKLVYILETR